VIKFFIDFEPFSYCGGKFNERPFKNNNLSILTSTILNLADIDKLKQQDLLKQAEEGANKTDINDQSKYLADQKVEVLKTLN